MASVRCVDNALGFQQYSTGITRVADATGNCIPVQGNHLRNIIEGADLVMSNILHFYHLTALDYINTNTGTDHLVSGQAPWSPKDQTADMVKDTLADTLVANYVEALNIRRKCHQLGAYASGKQPCQAALIPGGVTKVVDANLAGKMSGVLSDVKNFIDKTYLPNVVVVAKAFSGDLLAGTAGRGVGRGCKKFLSYGTFPDSANSMLLTGGFLNATAASHTSWTVYALNPANIEEHITYSYYYDDAFNSYTKLHPSVGATKPSYGKAGAYSWLKAPRYQTDSGSANCHVCEVGPLARVLVTYKQNSVPGLNAYVNAFITNSSGLNMNADTAIDALPSVLGRHAARAVETQVIADTMQSWIQSLTTTTATGETYRHRNIPRTSSTGFGLTEAPRGALGHWMRIDGRKISNYQCVVPTTWNGSPKDDYQQIGPIEHAISGSVVNDDATGRVRVGRIVRSFDPCIACAVHIVSPDKKKVTKFEVVPNR